MTGIWKTEQGCHNPGVSEAVSLGVVGKKYGFDSNCNEMALEGLICFTDQMC